MRVTIVGLGNVGSAVAHALFMAGDATELLLVSRDFAKVEGDALDFTHARALMPHAPEVRACVIEQTEDSQLVILTLSAKVPGKGRNAAVVENSKLLRTIVPPLVERSPRAVFLVVTNPVDAMTWLVTQESGLDPRQVFGCGTLIDSARFRVALSHWLKIHPDDLRAYVLGEHGDSQFPVASTASIGGVLIRDPDQVTSLFQEALRSPHSVVEKKGYTNFAIAQAVVMLARSVLLNQQRTFPVSTVVDGYLGIHDVCLSVPCVVGNQGISKRLFPELNYSEQEAFRNCAKCVRDTISLFYHPA